MKNVAILLTLAVVFFFSAFFLTRQSQRLVTPLTRIAVLEKPLEAYSFPKLSKTVFDSQQITLGKINQESSDFIHQMFYFENPIKPGAIEKGRVSGQITFPTKAGIYPVIVMIRGYVPLEIYETGIGTKRAAEAFAQNGFITLAPDFFGYGESSPPSKDSFEARFQTYTTTLTLLSSLQTLSSAIAASHSPNLQADVSKIGLWGHSNGGQIALSVLAISRKQYPSVLWAPVSKSFPYSILYYTDESDDQGKALRKALSVFEAEYDASLFSPAAYYSWIKAPLSIHQGTLDQEVPVWWSDELVSSLQEYDIDIQYKTYPADHNMLPSSWLQTVQDSIEFYRNNFNSR